MKRTLSHCLHIIYLKQRIRTVVRVHLYPTKYQVTQITALILKVVNSWNQHDRGLFVVSQMLRCRNHVRETPQFQFGSQRMDKLPSYFASEDSKNDPPHNVSKKMD
jgi:hypothetical protein